jgi:hypothetical protein
LGRIRATLDRATWKQWGFDLSPDEIARIDGFFVPWFEVYNRPGTAAYASQEAVVAVHHGFTVFMGDPPPGRANRPAISALRAGYCVASVEREMGMRPQPDQHLVELLSLMDKDEGWPKEPSLGRAFMAGAKVGLIAEQMTLESPDIGHGIPGFELREAVFADLRHTLFAKLTVTHAPRRFDRAAGELLMRFGHAAGYAEEALLVRSPRYEG